LSIRLSGAGYQSQPHKKIHSWWNRLSRLFHQEVIFAQIHPYGFTLRIDRYQKIRAIFEYSQVYIPLWAAHFFSLLALLNFEFQTSIDFG
jgi:hypothetical protein